MQNTVYSKKVHAWYARQMITYVHIVKMRKRIQAGKNVEANKTTLDFSTVHICYSISVIFVIVH